MAIYNLDHISSPQMVLRQIASKNNIGIKLDFLHVPPSIEGRGSCQLG